jgi:hypothetical protein
MWLSRFRASAATALAMGAATDRCATGGDAEALLRPA